MPNQSIAAVLARLMEEGGKSAAQVAQDTNIKYNTIYSILHRESARTSIAVLKVLADYFDEDLEVFCGESGYHKKPRLTMEEIKLVQTYRGLSPTDQASMLAVSSMPSTQKQILLGAQQLNSQGQERLLENCKDLIAGGRYQV